MVVTEFTWIPYTASSFGSVYGYPLLFYSSVFGVVGIVLRGGAFFLEREWCVPVGGRRGEDGYPV